MYEAQLRAGLAPYGYEEALLEHRRQHNIFEPDDWIIYAVYGVLKVHQVVAVLDAQLLIYI